MSLRDSSINSPDGTGAEARSANGRRILIVEDSPVVAPFTADVLGELGYVVVGPAPNMAAARELLEGDGLDGAIVDVHIRGERAYPLFELLAAKGVPFVLTSGYADRDQMPDKWRERPRLQKPYTMEQVEQALSELLDEPRRPAA